MKSINLVVLLAWLFWLFPLGLFSDDLSANEIMTKVSETYRGLRSYQLVAEISEEEAAAGEVRAPNGVSRATSNFHLSTTSQVDLAVVVPRKIRIHIKNDANEVLLISDGSTMWMYLPRKKQFSQEPVSAALAAQYQADAKVGPKIPAQNQDLLFFGILVRRYQDIFSFGSNFVLGKDKQIRVGKEKMSCYDLKMATPDGIHEVWVDRDRFIVWRSIDSPPAGAELANTIAFQKTTTVNLKSVSMSATMDDSLFTFTPPEKAVKVAPPTLK